MFWVPRWCYSWASRSQKVKSAEWSVNDPCKLQIPWNSLSRSLCSARWNWPKKKALLFGSPPSPSTNLVSLYTNVLFKMPWLSATTGNHCKLPMSVVVVQSSPLNILCHALRVASLPFDITKLGTWQLIYLQKSAMMSAMSLNFYHWWWGVHWHFLIHSGWCKIGYCC